VQLEVRASLMGWFEIIHWDVFVVVPLAGRTQRFAPTEFVCGRRKLGLVQNIKSGLEALRFEVSLLLWEKVARAAPIARPTHEV
jgi:hypothetical protein